MSAPCMQIQTEVYEIVNGIKVHICPNLSFKESKAFCTLIYNGEKFSNGKCTSSTHYNDIEIRREIFILKKNKKTFTFSKKSGIL